MPKDQAISETGPQLLSAFGLPGEIALPDADKRTRMGSGVITSFLSKGGMAIIYEIWNPDLEVTRAVKLLRPDHTQRSEERFHTEMKIAAKLHHQNIVEIYAVGKWKKLPYIEMELINGVTLEHLVREHGGLPLEVCTSVGIMVGRALNYAHNQDYVLYGTTYHGVIHRDLKPSNIMMTDVGVVKLMDFGIARPTTASIHTCDDTVMGTLQYIAPEQMDGKETDERTDMYSLGAVIYEMLTGVRAFPAVKLSELVPDKLSNRFIPLHEFDIKVPRGLSRLIDSCIRLEKDKRIPSSLAFLRALGKVHKRITPRSPEQIMADFVASPHGRKISVVGRRLGRRIFVAAVWSIAALVGAAGIGYGAYHLVNTMKTLPPRPLSTAEPAAPAAPSENAAAALRHIPDKPVPPSLEPAQAWRAATVPEPTAAIPHSTQPQVESPEAVSMAPSPPPTPKPSFLASLKTRYRTEDLVSILASETENRHYTSALRVYDHLQKQQARSSRAMLYKLRALQGAGRTRQVDEFLGTQDIHDGEFYLEKAKHYLTKGQLAEARALLKKASSSPYAFLDRTVFRNRLVYLKARCADRAFLADRNDRTRTEAMSAWYEVKSELRRSPEHRYYKAADERMKTISGDGL